MDCNEEEAIRAKSIAESKFTTMDIEGAKRFALKAKKLNPKLEGIPQMIATLNVHLSSTLLVNGERDWYSILGIQPSADDRMVKRRYRKLAVLLHPDKNKSIGAETAFKLVLEAWNVLSDRTKRVAYDERRILKEKNRKNSTSSHPNNTFWTSCKLCRMQYEYLRVYLNLTLLCPNCHESFHANEITFPSNYIHSSIPWKPENYQQSLKTVKKKRKGSHDLHEAGSTIDELGKADKKEVRQRKEQSRPAKRRSVDFCESVATKELFSQVDIRNMLMKRAKATVNKKLEEWNSKKQKKKQRLINSLILSQADTGPALDEAQKAVSITVPDPEFHDFDSDRSESRFGADQVWATYDDEDGMPRLYVMVQKVNSFRPFNVQLSFLNSKSTSEFGQVNWIESGFRKTCGNFRVGRYQPRSSINIFSHKVKWEKGQRGAVRILPQKGQVWAIYSNWSPDWSELTPDETLYKYDVVEVVETYTEENGIEVCPLEKVNGFQTVFRRCLDCNLIRRIPREEIFCLSHQVPYYVINGKEKENAPSGCYELDPAAAPLDISRGISEATREIEKT